MWDRVRFPSPSWPGLSHGCPVENRARVHSPVIPVLGTGIHEFGLFHPINPPEFRCSAAVCIEKVVDARAEHEHDGVWWRLRRFRVPREGGGQKAPCARHNHAQHRISTGQPWACPGHPRGGRRAAHRRIAPDLGANLLESLLQDNVDGRDKPGHDGQKSPYAIALPSMGAGWGGGEAIGLSIGTSFDVKPEAGRRS